ncbi:SGNH/GDSL hydrolase family protein [Cryobacterium sp.]|jgi:lysophospholipase L1-like esterase|uniref:SGNH/GDSL hydrolase family protein n=1 Tax=Cryobacterium sp. TaxID=1926290 RepID=UPI00262D253A|nr:SGNH/GDSL hydrolase family protein [Cryobacterium sp.]MCU1447498.1 hydrolase family protein [Cryobacterium sp.]
MKRRQISIASLGIVLAITASGCTVNPSSATAPHATQTPDDSAPTRTVVVIGDSIPFNSPDDCPGCVGFVESYAEALSDSSDEIYTAVNRSRHDGARVSDVLDEVESGSLDEALSNADVIIVSVGYNDQPPYGDGSCYDEAIDLDTVKGAAEALSATTADCIGTQTATAAANLADLLGGVRGLAPDASIRALTAYNAWTGWPDFEALGAETAGSASRTVAAGLLAWRTVVCHEAEKVGGDCVDLLTAFNGTDGLTPSGDLLAEDYTHPSQKGNELIRDLLLQR